MNWRIYLGYLSGQQLVDRVMAAGTTDTAAIVKAFEGHHFDGAKKSPSYWRECDHQNVQETYSAAIVPKAKRRSADEYFIINSAVGGDFAAESCSNPDSMKATAIFTSEKIPARDGYTVLKV
jgi:branched-chain amino acid transport system substrate-binding protein